VREVSFGAGCSGAELVFVPRKGARAEDGGYLAGFVFDENTTTSELRWAWAELKRALNCRLPVCAGRTRSLRARVLAFLRSRHD
jgi:hypothetical protein